MATTTGLGNLTMTRNILGRRVDTGFSTFTTNQTLAVYSTGTIEYTGTVPTVITLPSATTLSRGTAFLFVNNADPSVTVTLNGGTTSGTVASGNSALIVNLTNTTAAGTWEVIQLDRDMNSGSKYTATANATTDWGTAAGGEFTLTIPESTHNITAPSTVVVWNNTTPAARVIIPAMQININSTTQAVAFVVDEASSATGAPDDRRAIFYEIS